MLKKLRIYYLKIARARRINKLRKPIDPYLQKDFGVELNYKLWTTKGARFAASERHKVIDELSSKTVGYLSAYLIIINLINVYELKFIIELTDKELGFITTSLSILILIYSQFESAKNHSIKSEKFHQCSLEIAELYNELRMVKTFEKIENPEEKIKNISERYDIVLKKYDNHIGTDFKTFQTGKYQYFKLSKLDVKVIKLKKYFKVKFKYHFMIYSPVLLLLLFNLYKFLMK